MSVHEKALEAAARAVCPLAWERDGHWDRHGRRFDRERSERLARAAILAFLGAVEVKPDLSFGSTAWCVDDDMGDGYSADVIRAALAQLRREIEGSRAATGRG